MKWQRDKVYFKNDLFYRSPDRSRDRSPDRSYRDRSRDGSLERDRGRERIPPSPPAEWARGQDRDRDRKRGYNDPDRDRHRNRSNSSSQGEPGNKLPSYNAEVKTAEEIQQFLSSKKTEKPMQTLSSSSTNSKQNTDVFGFISTG